MGAPIDGRLVGWKVSTVLGQLFPPGADTSGTHEEDFSSEEVGAIFDTALWSDKVLASSTNRRSLVALDQVTLKTVGNLPFKAPSVNGRPADPFFPSHLEVAGDVAFMSFEASDRVGIYRFELKTGKATHHVFPNFGVFPQLCATKGSVFIAARDDRQVFRLDPENLSVTGHLSLEGDPFALSCSTEHLFVGYQDSPRVVRFSADALKLAGTATWQGAGAESIFVLDDSSIIATDSTANIIAWCSIGSACEQTEVGREPLEIVRLDDSMIGVVVRGNSRLDVLESKSRSVVGTFPLPREPRGALVY